MSFTSEAIDDDSVAKLAKALPTSLLPFVRTMSELEMDKMIEVAKRSGPLIGHDGCGIVNILMLPGVI